jgi:DNA-binding transcriptional ArsR family regulator
MPSCIVNQVVQYQSPSIDRSLAAIADPTRREILERLGRGQATISELAEPFGMSLTGLKKHVAILEEAGLVTTEKVGRTRCCRLSANPLDEITQWIESYRQTLSDRLDRFEALLERRKGTTP